MTIVAPCQYTSRARTRSFTKSRHWQQREEEKKLHKTRDTMYSDMRGGCWIYSISLSLISTQFWIRNWLKIPFWHKNFSMKWNEKIPTPARMASRESKWNLKLELNWMRIGSKNLWKFVNTIFFVFILSFDARLFARTQIRFMCYVCVCRQTVINHIEQWTASEVHNKQSYGMKIKKK